MSGRKILIVFAAVICAAITGAIIGSHAILFDFWSSFVAIIGFAGTIILHGISENMK